MGYKRFEELPVWQASIELALATYAMTAQSALRRQRSLRGCVGRETVEELEALVTAVRPCGTALPRWL
jgi:hypothetical protein